MYIDYNVMNRELEMLTEHNVVPTLYRFIVFTIDVERNDFLIYKNHLYGGTPNFSKRSNDDLEYQALSIMNEHNLPLENDFPYIFHKTTAGELTIVAYVKNGGLRCPESKYDSDFYTYSMAPKENACIVFDNFSKKFWFLRKTGNTKIHTRLFLQTMNELYKLHRPETAILPSGLYSVLRIISDTYGFERPNISDINTLLNNLNNNLSLIGHRGFGPNINELGIVDILFSSPESKKDDNVILLSEIINAPKLIDLVEEVTPVQEDIRVNEIAGICNVKEMYIEDSMLMVVITSKVENQVNDIDVINTVESFLESAYNFSNIKVMMNKEES